MWIRTLHPIALVGANRHVKAVGIDGIAISVKASHSEIHHRECASASGRWIPVVGETEDGSLGTGPLGHQNGQVRNILEGDPNGD